MYSLQREASAQSRRRWGTLRARLTDHTPCYLSKHVPEPKWERGINRMWKWERIEPVHIPMACYTKAQTLLRRARWSTALRASVLVLYVLRLLVQYLFKVKLRVTL